MFRRSSYLIFGLLVLLFTQAGKVMAQNLNGEVITVAADALTVLKFNSEIKRYELGDRNGYTCQVRDNDNSVVIKTLGDSCGATNLIVNEGKRSHYFIIHFQKEIDINKTKLFYDYSDLKELKRIVNSSDALASNSKEDKKEKKEKQKEKEELEAKDKEAQKLADAQKKKEEEALAANKPSDKDALASAEPVKKNKKKSKEPEQQPEPVAQTNDEPKTTGVNNNTAQPYKEEPIVGTQQPAGKKNKKDKKVKSKQAEPKEEPAAVANNNKVATADTAKVVDAQALASVQEPAGKKNKKDKKVKDKPGQPAESRPAEQTVVVANNTAMQDTSHNEPVQVIASAVPPAKSKKENKPKKIKEPVVTPEKKDDEPKVVAATNETPEKEPASPSAAELKKDSIAREKAELHRLMALEKERQALAKKYPGINFAEPPEGQMLTGDFFLPNDTAENYRVSNEILKKAPGTLNISSTNDKGLEVTLQDITFSGVNAYMRLLIRNNGKAEVPVGRMNVQWNKNNGLNVNLFACYVTSFPIIAPGKEVTIVYSTRAVNATNADNFIFTMNDRQDKFSTNLGFGGDVYNKAMGGKP